MKHSISAFSLLCICLLTSCSIFKGGSDAPSGDIKKDKKLTSEDQVPTDPLLEKTEAEAGDIGSMEEKTISEGRIIKGFLEPNVSELPNKKDLQESVNVAPLPEALAPKDIEPVTPVLEDPNAPLPENQ